MTPHHFVMRRECRYFSTVFPKEPVISIKAAFGVVASSDQRAQFQWLANDFLSQTATLSCF